MLSNPKSEYRNTKWFGPLTILNQVEGQIINSNVPKGFGNLDLCHLVLFLISCLDIRACIV